MDELRAEHQSSLARRISEEARLARSSIRQSWARSKARRALVSLVLNNFCLSIEPLHSGKYCQFLAHYKIQIFHKFWAQKSWFFNFQISKNQLLGSQFKIWILQWAKNWQYFPLCWAGKVSIFSKAIGFRYLLSNNGKHVIRYCNAFHAGRQHRLKTIM